MIVCHVIFINLRRVLYVVTYLDAIVEQYRMDGQGGAIKTFDYFEDYTIKAMTIDYENNYLYFKINDGNEPSLLSRTNHDFTNLRRSIIDFNSNAYYFGPPLSPFAVHSGFLYMIIKDRGLRTFFIKDSRVYSKCINTQVNTPVYSTKVIHYGRQPGEFILQHITALYYAMYCTGFHWCQIDNGGCDGLCLPQKFGRRCQCPSHQIYDTSSNKCKGEPRFHHY